MREGQMDKIIEIDGYKIETHHEYPPIPVRSFDWSAAIYDGDYDYDCEDGKMVFVGTDPVGYGPTEEKAIDDLLEQLRNRDEFRKTLLTTANP